MQYQCISASAPFVPGEQLPYGARCWRATPLLQLELHLLCRQYRHLMPRRVSTAIWFPIIGRIRRHRSSRESQLENRRCVPFFCLVYQAQSQSMRSSQYGMAVYPSQNEYIGSVEAQTRGYVPFPHVYCLLSKPSSGLAKNLVLVHLSTTLTMTHLSTYFLSVDQISSTTTNIPISSGIGAANTGGTSSSKFAEDGDISSFLSLYTCVSTSFVRTARPWQTCWPIHLLFRSLSITILKTVILSESQKMKRG